MTTKKVYSKSPINEAICEFEFKSTNNNATEWIKEVFAKKYNQTNERFFKRVDLNFNANQPTEIIEHPTIHKLFFNENEKNKIVQIYENFLVINFLRPYTSWEDFLRFILTNYEIYKDKSPAKELKRVSLRYINQFDLENVALNLKDYFTIYVEFPKRFDKKPTQNSQVLEFLMDEKDKMILVFNAFHSHKESKTKILLDLTYQTVLLESNEKNLLTDTLNNAHLKIEELFEEIITDNIRNLIK